MKKAVCLILAMLMILSLSACNAPAMADTTPSQSMTTTTQTKPEIVVFQDPLLEAMIREAMGIPSGDITVEEAGKVTELILNIDWQQQPVEGTQIKSISGLENFVNLEKLELHFHAIKDISPLKGLTKLTALSLGGNPVEDITPLKGLTELSWLTLFNCQAEDYTPLANLTKLGGLLLDHSTFSDAGILSGLTELWWLSLSNTAVSDVSPLAALVNLTKLQLEGCPVTDYSPLSDIYPNLEEADFVIVSSLREIGFSPINNAPQVESYKIEGMYIQVHRIEWGERENKSEENSVLMCKNYGTDNEIMILYYPDTMTYLVFSSAADFRYTYDVISDEMNIEYGGENADAFMEQIYDEVDPYPAMTPIKDFTRTISDTFGVSPDILYYLPREKADSSSLLSLGFKPDEDNACYLYEQHDPWYYNIEVNNPEWGNLKDGGSVRFFTPFSDEYRLVVTYFADEKKYVVGADDNDGGGASFEYYADTDVYMDIWCSDKKSTVEMYFKNAIDDPAAEDIYKYSVDLMNKYIRDTFGLSVTELFALPAGD